MPGNRQWEIRVLTLDTSVPGISLPPIPVESPKTQYPPVTPNSFLPLWDTLQYLGKVSSGGGHKHGVHGGQAHGSAICTNIDSRANTISYTQCSLLGCWRSFGDPCSQLPRISPWSCRHSGTRALGDPGTHGDSIQSKTKHKCSCPSHWSPLGEGENSVDSGP